MGCIGRDGCLKEYVLWLSFGEWLDLDRLVGDVRMFGRDGVKEERSKWYYRNDKDASRFVLRILLCCGR